MPDDKTKTAPQDAQRININEDYEVQHWSKEFRVTPDELRQAVRKVGVMGKDVKKELGK